MAAAIRSVAVTRKWSLWEAAGPAGVVDLRGDGLEMCAGQDPVDASPPVRPVKKWTVPSLRVATGWAARKTSCGDDTGLECADTQPLRGRRRIDRLARS